MLPTFVPAGFVDVGHSVVRDASSGKNLVIVDSVQSMANHLEATLLGEPGQVVPGLENLPYVRLTITDPAGRTRITSSLELPHRLASGWFCKAKELLDFQQDLAADILDHGIAAATFRRCPNSLLHGVFYSQLAGLDPNVAKTPRLLSAEVVATGAQSIADGGVAKDPLFPSGEGFDVESLVGAKATAAEVGAGYIPYRHQAFIAEGVELSVYLAEGRITRLTLPDPAKNVLRLLARYKLARLLAEPLDLRAHCIFQAEQVPPELADAEAILHDLQTQLSECRRLGLFVDPVVSEFALTLGAAKEKSKKAKASGAAVAVVEEDNA
ncbi:type I-U CRISPR-associated RAMP protein Csb1/Cas7u [Synechococcus sp. CS-205]|uniref:type I-G CRISPR-associated RAMP protein Csb1/Cas7g n=1 Tax=Synechococcus sp. CS-205 TaxID=2847984 RepID=UPI00223B27EA|nr:type I-U CRISPR-associated RAMP protein Csb1/Cas7u [Synechococcus sp. CS-205]MCT0247874.1 type I-U CRISPR-associated protein Cas7 [Synechococcus sp. CS-205]